MKITVLYNTNTSTANDPLLKIADDDTIETAKAAADALASLGHDVNLFDVTEESFSELLYIDTEFYFNLTEGIGSIPKSFVDVAEELEKIDFPFSGSSSFSLALTTDKAKVKELFQKKGISTPKFVSFLGNYDFLTSLKFPLIVKPSGEDSSVGINQDSVVFSERDLRKKIEKIKNDFAEPLLIEEYIVGREFAVTVFGNGRSAKVLPIYEVKFGLNDKIKIYDYQTKWDQQSQTYIDMDFVCPTDTSLDLQKNIEELAISAFQITKCSDYARIDFRIAEDGTPYILEVNANPGLGPNAEVSISAKAQGISYSRFMEMITIITLKRFYRNSFERYQPLVSL